jgi:hypothetical protein
MPSTERILGNYFSYEPVGVLPFNHSSGRLDCTARTPGLQMVIERVIALEVQKVYNIDANQILFNLAWHHQLAETWSSCHPSQ